MQKRQRPKKTDSHNNSKRSLLNLTSIFPENWNIVSLEDVFSKYEYGQDWLVQIVLDDGDVTSTEFRVQSKVFSTKKQTKDDHLTAQINVSTINYLAELLVPVIIHYYDNINKCGYWLWLHEWYVKNYSTEWKNQEKVNVVIQKSQHLDSNAVAQITEYVDNHHRVYSSIEMARLVSRHNDDFSIKVEKSDNGVRFSFEPKHANAQFNILTDTEGLRQMKLNDDTGEEVSFAGSIKVNEVFDQFFEKVFGDKTQITINTNVDQELLLQIQFLDSADNIVVHVPLVRMKTKEYGKTRVVMEGVHEGIKYTLKSDTRKKEVKLNLSLTMGLEDLIGLAKGFELFEKTIKSSKTKIQNLEKPDVPILWDNGEHFLDMPFSELEIRLIKALSIIQSESKIVLQPPARYSEELLYDLEGIAEGLQKGKTRHLVGLVSNELSYNLTTHNPAEMMSLLLTGNIAVPLPPDQLIITLFDVEINLGQRFIEFEHSSILNLEEITQKLMQAPNDEEITLDVNVDRNKARMIFANWPKRKKFDSALSQVADVEPIEGDEL